MGKYSHGIKAFNGKAQYQIQKIYFLEVARSLDETSLRRRDIRKPPWQLRESQIVDKNCRRSWRFRSEISNLYRRNDDFRPG
jgi:hypothetical protein